MEIVVDIFAVLISIFVSIVLTFMIFNTLYRFHRCMDKYLGEEE